MKTNKEPTSAHRSETPDPALGARLDHVLAEAVEAMGVGQVIDRVAWAIAPRIETEHDCAAAVLCLLAHSEAHDVHTLLAGLADRLGRELVGHDGERSLADLLAGPNASN